jgi:hypothetical protein
MNLKSQPTITLQNKCFLLFLPLGGKKDPENDYFDDIGTCIVKTSAMFVGELEFGDIPFRNKIKSFSLRKKT